MLVKELIATENEITPIIIKIKLNDCSDGVLLVISPNPTVVTVVTMKYKLAKYWISMEESR